MTVPLKSGLSGSLVGPRFGTCRDGPETGSSDGYLLSSPPTRSGSLVDETPERRVVTLDRPSSSPSRETDPRLFVRKITYLVNRQHPIHRLTPIPFPPRGPPCDIRTRTVTEALSRPDSPPSCSGRVRRPEVLIRGRGVGGPGTSSPRGVLS